MKKVNFLVLSLTLLISCTIVPFYHFDYINKNLPQYNNIVASPSYRSKEECEIMWLRAQKEGYITVSSCYSEDKFKENE